MIKKNWLEILLGFFIALYIGVFSWMTIVRNLSFGSYYYDLGIMNQVAYNTAHGRFLMMTNQDFAANVSRFAIHFDPILAIFAPFYWLWNGPEVLLIGQTIILALGAVAVYLLAIHIISHSGKTESHPESGISRQDPGQARMTDSKPYALMFAVTYLLYFPLHWQNMFDVHGVALATTFLLFAIYFTEIKRFKHSFAFIILSLLCKEHVGLVVGMYGLYLMIFKRYYRFGLLVIATGVAFFIGTVFYIIPHARSVNSFYLRYFESVGDGPGGVITGLIRNPLLIFQYLFDFERSGFLWRLIDPYFSFLIFWPFAFLVAAPEMLINLLSSNPNMRAIFHYNALTIPFVIYSSLIGFTVVHKKIGLRRILWPLALISFVGMNLWYVYKYAVLPLPYLRNPYYKVRTIDYAKLSTVRSWQEKLSDPNIKVSTTPQLAPFFTSRYFYDNFLYDPSFEAQGLKKNVIIETLDDYEGLDYVIIAEVEIPQKRGLAREFYEHLVNNPRFELIENTNGIEVYKKK